MSQEGFALSETGNEGCELTRRAIYFMLQRGSTIGSVLGGLVAATDLETTYAGSGLKISVAPGEAIVAGHNATQSGYYFRNTSADTITPPAANLSNPRIERLVAQVHDASYEGASNSFALELLNGTPTPGATLTNLSGVAAAPNSSMTLAYVLIPAAATTISNADIKNVAEGVKLGPKGLPIGQLPGARKEIKAGEPHEPNASAGVLVVADFLGKAKTHFNVEIKVEGGLLTFIEVPEVESSTPFSVPVTFFVAAGKKWEYVVLTGEIFNCEASYTEMV
jgi:hypothetical protein